MRTFSLAVPLADLIGSNDVDGFNDYVESRLMAQRKIPQRSVLSDIGYRPLRVVGEDVVIEITATVESTRLEIKSKRSAT